MLLAAAAASPCALAAAAQWSDPSRAAALCLMLSAPIAFGFPLLRLRLPAGAKAWGRLAIASSLAWAWLAAALFAATPLANAFEPLEIYEAEAVSKKCSGGECRVGLFEHRQNKHFHALLKEQAAPEVGELAADCWRKSWAGLHRWRFEKGGPCGSRIQAAGAVPPGTGASIRARH